MNKLHHLFVSALFGLFLTVMPAQAQIRIAPVTSIGDTVTCHIGANSFQYQPDHRLISAQSWSGKAGEAQAIFNKVSDYTNLRTTVYTVPVTDRRVNVEICPGDRNYIVYNADWVKALYDETNSLWVLYAVMAHEIGHYVRGHQHTQLGSTPEIELEADEYAGEVLAKMGASLSDAQVAFKSATMRPRSHTHPSINRRVAAVEVGWTKVGRSQVAESSERSSDGLPNVLKNAIWLEGNVVRGGEAVYLEFEPNGKVRSRTSSDLIGYVAWNVKWFYVAETLQVQLLDPETKKVVIERRGAMKGDRVEGDFKDFRNGMIIPWSLTRVTYIPLAKSSPK